MNDKQSVNIWDFPVRIFHWLLVLFFIIAYLTSEDAEELHEFAGYTVLALISFRVLWGFIGSQYARFRNFIYSPVTVLDYVKSLRGGNPRHYLGHNPLGGWMVVALLVMLFVVTLSGVKLELMEEGKSENKVTRNETIVVTGERNSMNSSGEERESDKKNSREEFWEEIHEASTNIMLVLIFLHLVGVISSSRLHKENLVKAMITGKKEKQ